MQFDLGISSHLSEILVGVVLLFVTVREVRRPTMPRLLQRRSPGAGRSEQVSQL